MIYLDNSATTRPHREVLETYINVSERFFGNASSLHRLGIESEKVLNRSRAILAELLEVESSTVLFTSGGTESNNVAIKGSLLHSHQKGNHLITTKAEHASVYQVFKELESEGYHVSFLPVDQDGLVSVEQLEQAITKETTLVSISHVNNETGTIQPIYEIGQLLHRYPKIRFHVDHVQGAGKVPLSIKQSHIDLLTMSAHKFHGLKGTALLYVRPGLHLTPLFHGGEQEFGFRGGTENVAGAAAMAKAYKIHLEKAPSAMPGMKKRREQLIHHINRSEGITLNSHPTNGALHIINLSVPGYKPEVIVQKLAEKEMYVSTQSACSSKLNEPSRVLLAMGKEEELAASAIRISLSFESSDEEVYSFLCALDQLLPSIRKVVKK
ncbi:cysteine desulfurase family protein [Alkalicoccobacillus murimartini]|uniref:Cysteine desulfurase n=1 Tax=Alkalicoccobacillus murimartini TaxID=171685 RepID=A0ABT9YJU0_9BACI|nr:cysteine desulfurase family protein [Alkalicoccobacillus murimartini]MDQ0208129.1 cysteine desulfurase [Alkalicoccobacillus murimartini]